MRAVQPRVPPRKETRPQVTAMLTQIRAQPAAGEFLRLMPRSVKYRMQSHGVTYLYGKFRRIRRQPLFGQFDLTYKCDYNCVHCYCQKTGSSGRELSTAEIKTILDEIHREGCLWLALTGGDPLARPDFKEIYLYARQKGFILTILTNGYRLNADMTRFFTKYPPCSIDITVNSLKEKNYRKIISIPQALDKVKKNVKLAAKAGLNMIIKANCLKENKGEIGAIKQWSENILGKPADNLYRFRYDKIIFPRLDSSKEPCRHRLNVKELSLVHMEDEDMEQEYCRALQAPLSQRQVKDDHLYACDSWKTSFFIDPYGRLKFCSHSDKFSTDLRQQSFHHGFYNEFAKIAKARFKSQSPCRWCDLRLYCYSCPAIACLETGDEEKPAPYFCRMARQFKNSNRDHQIKNEKSNL
jgi:radical SAM protein with 4Fe4S-binding SPASM domain